MNRQILEVTQLDVKIGQSLATEMSGLLCKRQPFLVIIHHISNPRMKSHRG